MKWKNKKDVYMLSTLHTEESVNNVTERKNGTIILRMRLQQIHRNN
jgi:hypothetical protein